MRAYLPQPGTIALAITTAIIVMVVGAITQTYNVIAAGVVTIVVVLLITAGIEGARRRGVTQSAGLTFEVQRTNGKREIVTLDPTNEESVARFSQALKEDFARRAPPEAAAALRKATGSEAPGAPDSP